jgi:uncharacterized protein (DUF433 family)
MFDRITFDPKIMGGRACIRGMRIPVSVIIGQIAHGATMDEVMADYPDLEPGDVQCIRYRGNGCDFLRTWGLPKGSSSGFVPKGTTLFTLATSNCIVCRTEKYLKKRRRNEGSF